MTAIDELGAHLRAHSSAPILFVGSGLSRRYLRLPDWAGLLQQLAELTGRPYGYFVTGGDGQYPAIATAIAEAFHELWWTEGRFEASRSEFGSGLRTRQGPLKVEVAQLVTAGMQNLPTTGPLHLELESLKKAVVDAIITTNYDPLLEELFEEFHRYVGQDELLFTDPQGIGEIYKIHGDVASPETIVLTSDDFDEFEARNPYLAAKLLTLFVEHPIIFLGYSLQDPDVTSILGSIARVLTRENLERLEGNLILVEWDADVREPVLTRGLVSAAGFSIGVKVLQVGEFLTLFELLGSLEHKFSAAVLRRLKQRVYELVLSNQPADRLFVDNIENAPHEDVDVVMGVGMEAKLSDRGYRGIQRIDLLQDVLQPHSAYNARRIVEETLPEVLRGAGVTPIYRYLSEAGFLNSDATLLKNATVDDKIRQRVTQGPALFAPPPSVRARAERIVDEASGRLSLLIERNPTSVVLAAAAALPANGLDLDRFVEYLNETRFVFTDQPSDRANWARLVGRYDYLKFGVAGG